MRKNSYTVNPSLSHPSNLGFEGEEDVRLGAFYGPASLNVCPPVENPEAQGDSREMLAGTPPGTIQYDTGPVLSGAPLKPAIGSTLDQYGFTHHATDIPKAHSQVESLYFKDGKKRIDFILVYSDDNDDEDKKKKKRAVYEKHLNEEGLELEREDKANSRSGKLYFLKVHAPWPVLTQYAEFFNMKMPIKNFVVISNKAWSGEEVESEQPTGLCGSNYCINPLEYDHSKIPPEPEYFTAGFNRNREDQFVIKNRDTFFTSAQRSFMVYQVLQRARYDMIERDKIGINRLLNNDTYLAAYPLHEGSYHSDKPGDPANERRLLYEEWARPQCWYKKQPLWLVRKYFGDQIGLYFAWLGFYTQMLIPPAVVGLLCFLYGVIFMDSDDSKPIQEICQPDLSGNLTMCPLCDRACKYWKLSDSCQFSKISYLFDNPATVFFSIFMAFWATMFLELWKRKQSVIAWEWDLVSFEDEEEPRPEFEAKVHTYRINPVTMRPEPYLPRWNRVMRFVAVINMVLFMMVLVMAAVFGVIAYRLTVMGVMSSSNSTFVQKNAKLVVTFTASGINLVVILILDKIYQYIAVWLTNMETPRTQTEYEDSYTFKMFLFQFINFYSSLIYIAFFKGQMYGYPGNESARSSFKHDLCDPAGCLFELCVQLAIVMVGKQGLNNFKELILPKLSIWFRRFRLGKKQTEEEKEQEEAKKVYTRWEQDYLLDPLSRMALFDEYLEMVIQYGFVTLFVAAFPLAPLLALINNIIEIRLDAYNFVTMARRPLAKRAQDIGAWFGILQSITYLAVVSNAFVISFTSDFVPKLVYLYYYSKTGDLTGYMNVSLSVFNTSDYGLDMEPDPNVDNRTIPTCRYKGYRNPPNHPDAYQPSDLFWHIIAGRVIFVVVFEHIVLTLTSIMAYVIPDVPVEVKTQIARERLLAKEAMFESENNKRRGSNADAKKRPMSSPSLFGGDHLSMTSSRQRLCPQGRGVDSRRSSQASQTSVPGTVDPENG